METYTYFAEPFKSYDDVVEAYGPIYDATTLQKVADCPRAHQIRVEHNWERPEPTAPMIAGIAVHYGLEYYYAHSEPTTSHEATAINLMEKEWDRFDINEATRDPKHLHLTKPHLADVMRNYFNYWNRQQIEIYRPLGSLTVDQIDFSDVLAAHFYLTPEGEIILGESKLVMKFGELVLAGKPDLPVRKQNGDIYIMDHKSTSGNLGAYHEKNFQMSNQLRGYMAMVRSLLGGRELAGAVINALNVGSNALNPNSKAAKFDRYEFDFTPDHVDETINNQLAWARTIKHYQEEGYFPQGCGYGGCSYPDVCRRDPSSRAAVLNDPGKFVQSTREFWSL